MASSTVGTATRDIPLTPITIKNMLSSAAATSSTNTTNTRHLIPKGTYTVTAQPMGFAIGGSSVFAANYTLGGGEFTILTQYADTGRPGPFLMGDNVSPKGNMLILQRDAYVQIAVRNSNGASGLNDVGFDVTFTPTYSAYKSLGTVTGNRTSTGSSASTDTADINMNCVQVGWDYDRNLPFIITTNASLTSGRTRATDFYLYRANTSGTWDITYWNSVVASSGNSFYNGSGIGFRGNANSIRQSSFFIKTNELHNLDMSGLMTDASSNRWGWIKGNISAGTFTGSTLTMSPGHTNTAFATASSQIGTGTDNIMIYHHDRVNNKVIYNGCRDSTYSGAYGNYGWRHNWAQWDIATNTVDYQNVNGVVDPRIAGQSNEANMAWTCAVPNGSTGLSYAVGDNSGQGYLARFSRTGTYTGVGNFQSRNVYSGSTNLGAYAGSPQSYDNNMIFFPNGVMVAGQSMNFASIDYLNTALSQPIATTDSTTLFQSGARGLNASMGISNTKYIVIVIANAIVLVETGYVKANGNGTIGRYIPITVYMAPATTANLSAILPGQGGIGSAANGNSGINNGGY
jgi:hypothetical protein